MWVQSLTLLIGLRILHCHKMWCRCDSDVVLPWLWHRLQLCCSVAALIWLLAKELPYASSVAIKQNKNKQKTPKETLPRPVLGRYGWQPVFFPSLYHQASQKSPASCFIFTHSSTHCNVATALQSSQKLFCQEHLWLSYFKLHWSLPGLPLVQIIWYTCICKQSLVFKIFFPYFWDFASSLTFLLLLCLPILSILQVIVL